jgi:hypothetical protein
MKAKLAKKNRFPSILTLVFTLYGCMLASFAQAQTNANQRCEWQNVGTHRQTPLLPLLRKDLSGNRTHFVSLTAALAQYEGNFYLQIYIEIDDVAAAALFGDVPPAAKITLMPTSKAENISLDCPKGAKANLQNGRLSYNCIYSLDKKNIAKLKTLEIGQIELQWANGQQKYDVFDVDFFRRLLPCAK